MNEPLTYLVMVMCSHDVVCVVNNNENIKTMSLNNI